MYYSMKLCSILFFLPFWFLSYLFARVGHGMFWVLADTMGGRILLVSCLAGWI
jgi:hypothetical protein